ncbi:MAG: heparinase II/III family protein [Gemmatimonadota bacterium]
MTLLLKPGELEARRAVVSGGLAPLVASLRGEMDRVLREAPAISGQKAMLTRDGGRCPNDGAQLEFDPYSPHAHRCHSCGAVQVGERHHRWWLMFAQLWRAERAVHGAVLHALGREPQLAAFARATLEEYADRYARYPLDDNVLGPSRPFFSTYLESIWLLQLCIAADLLDVAGEGGAATSRFRERVAQPSAALIRSYDEGESNRQLWNNAAMLAAGRALDDTALAGHAVQARSGLIAQLGGGLLPDGSWYEGENYHLFSHRGLWYGVVMAEAAGYEIPAHLLARFQDGFSIPFLTAFPDLGFPARRDSQYGASLRQWRTADACELGLARADDPSLTGALAALYANDIPRRDTGRWRSAAEAERNEPASALSRADIGWRSLLFARKTLPPLDRATVPSALLEGQGIAVFRREHGEGYTALDYGHHGGGHGHPDRLNVLLARGTRRILDDMGTGSYVDPSLHWYRSTLAHNAPLVDGHSQPRTSGALLAYDERDHVGWACASARISVQPPVTAQRALTVLAHAVIDELRWSSDSIVQLDLPIHVRARVESDASWRDGELEGGDELEDGFRFAHDVRHASIEAGDMVRLVDEATGAILAWVTSAERTEWFSALAPDAPGAGEGRFLLVRTRASAGTIRIVWNPSFVLREVTLRDEELELTHTDGTSLSYRWSERGAHIDTARPAGEPDRVLLTGFRAPEAHTHDEVSESELATPSPSTLLPLSLPFSRDLGETDYRMSEHRWADAGSPRARVEIESDRTELSIRVEVRKAPLHFRAADAEDPALDNEHPDINSDGVQLHLWCEGWREPAAWLAIPERGFTGTRVRQISGGPAAPAPDVRSREIEGGYELRFAIPRSALSATVALDVLVNEMAAGRQRRRGQLVLSGARGDRVYLRGDRQPLDNFLRVRLSE